MRAWRRGEVGGGPSSERQSRWAGPFEFYITISMIYEVAASFWVVRQRFQKR